MPSVKTSRVKLEICPVSVEKFPERLLRLLERLSHDMLRNFYLMLFGNILCKASVLVFLPGLLQSKLL